MNDGQAEVSSSSNESIDVDGQTLPRSPASTMRPTLTNIKTDLTRRPREATGNTAGGNTTTTAASASDRIFSQLQRIQELQSGITAEHISLENLNGDSSSEAFAGGRGKAAGASASVFSEAEMRKSPQAHANERRTAADAYDKLAADFQERQKGVSSMLDKLKDLSEAVKAFHQLPPPSLFPDAQSRAKSAKDDGSAHRNMHGRELVVASPVAMTPARSRFA